MGKRNSAKRRSLAQSVTASLLSVACGTGFVMAMTAAAPAHAGLQGPQSPCDGGGSTCYHNGLMYADGTFVTQRVTEFADGSGDAMDVYNFYNTQTKTWEMDDAQSQVFYYYVDGVDEYGYPTTQLQAAYAPTSIPMESGKTLDLSYTMAAGSGGGRISNLADGVAPMDAVNKRQLDSAMANAGGNDPLAVKYTDGNRNAVSVGGRVTNIADGVAGNDAASVNQVNSVTTVAQDGVNRAVRAQNTADTAKWTADKGVTDAATALQVGNEGRTLARSAQGTADTARSEAANAQFTANKGVTDAKGASDLAAQSGRMAVAAQATADGIARYAVATPGAAGDVAATAGPEGAVALGYGTTAGSNHVAVGQGAVSMEAGEPGSRGAAVGYNARARGNATAIGGEAAADDFAVAVGRSAEADVRGSAFGASSYAMADSVALGNGSRATEANTVSVGNAEVKRRIVNVADGVAASDAVTMKQHGELTGEVIQIRDTAMRYTGAAFSARRDGYATRIAGVADATDANDAVNKRQLDALAGEVGVIGGDALKFDGTAYNAIREGAATRISGVADGVGAGDAVNRGQLDGVEGQAQAAQRTADHVGADLAALDARAVQFTGPNGAIAAKGARVVDLADGIDATDAVNKRQLDAVATDLGKVSENALLFDGTTYNATRGGAATRISGVADGVDSLDAVNKSQLDTVRDELAGVAGDALLFDGTAYNAERSGAPTRITGVAAGVNATDATNFTQLSALTSALGAGAGWNNGGFSGPQYRIGSVDFGNVGDAFAAVDGKLAGLEGRVSDVEQSPAITRPVIYDDASKDALTLEGPGGTRISNLAAGINGTDAANLNQVRQGIGESRAYTDTKAQETLKESKAYTDSRIADVWGGMDDMSRQVNMRFGQLDRRIDRQSAMTSAMVQMATNAGGSRSEFGRVGAGIGWSGGQRALSVGWSKSIGRGSFSFGGAISGGESSAGIGFGIDL